MLATLLQPAFLWFYIATCFLIAELIAPSFIAIFFSAGCLSASLAAWLLRVDLAWQISIFISATLLSLLFLRKLCLQTFSGTNTSDQDQDNYDQQYIGKQVVVTKAIIPPQQGEVKLAGSFWLAQAEENMAVGDNGVVVSTDPTNPLIVRIKPD